MRVGCLGITLAAIVGCAVGVAYVEISRFGEFLSREVYGRVVGPDGQPLRNARVELRTKTAQSMFNLSFSSATGWSTFTDENGAYRLRRLDQCLVYVAKPGYVADYVFPNDDGAGNLALRRASSLTGTIVTDDGDVPVHNAQVTIFDESFRDERRSTTTNVEGTFRFDDLDPERAIQYCVQVPGFAPVGGVESVVSAERTSFVIRVPSTPVLRGQVLDLASGEPIPDAILVDLDRSQLRESEVGRTDSDGTFQLRGYTFDRPWTIEARKAGYVGSRRAFELAGKRTRRARNAASETTFETVDMDTGFHGNTGSDLERGEWLANGFVCELGMLRPCVVEATVRTTSGAKVDSFWVTVDAWEPVLDVAGLAALGIRLPPGLTLGEFDASFATTSGPYRVRLDRFLPGADHGPLVLHANGAEFEHPLAKFSHPGEVRTFEWRVSDTP